jgi:hypothetical protein
MVNNNLVRMQLNRIGHRLHFFGRAEIKELQNILQPEESIIQCAYGYYQGGSGLLVATDKRLLLIDKRPFYLNLESLPYDHIREIDFVPRLLQASLFLQIGMKKLIFRSISDARLRLICTYTKERIELIEKPIFAVVHASPKPTSKPYLNPSWRPHHSTFLRKQRPTKFHSETTRTATS